MDNYQPLDLFDEGISIDDVTSGNSFEAGADTLQEEKDKEVASRNEVPTEQISNEDSAVQNVGEEVSLKEESEVTEDTAYEPPEKSPDLGADLRPDIGELKIMSEKMSVQLEELSQLFNKRILHTEYEERIVDQMHNELQKYKEDMYAQLVRPILMDIIEVRDSIMRIAATYLTKPEGEQNIPNKTFFGYSYDLQDILEKNNVEIYRSTEGEMFTPVKQRAVKKVPTSDQSLHGKIAESLSCGYNYKGRTISAEKIAVYSYVEAQKEENEEKCEVN